MKKPNFISTIRYEIPTFLSVGPFFEEGGRGSIKFRPEAEIFRIFSIEVAPKNVMLLKYRPEFNQRVIKVIVNVTPILISQLQNCFVELDSKI